MGKRRNKKNTKQNITPTPLQAVNINLPENMSMEEMQHMIACAIIEAEEIKAQKEEERHKIAQAKWHKKIGYKEYDNKFLQFLNDLKSFKNILVLPKKDIEGDRASVILLKLFLYLFFCIMQFFSLLFSVVFIAYVPIQYFREDMNKFPWYLYAYFAPLALFSFILARLFRMADAEIENIEDRSYLFGLFTSVTSFVSIIIAVVSIVKGA